RSEYLDALLRQAFVALAEIRDASIRAIRKAQRDEHRISVNNLARLRAHRLRKDKHRQCSRQILHQVNEVTDLADDPAAALLCVLCPVFLRNPTSVHSIQY